MKRMAKLIFVALFIAGTASLADAGEFGVRNYSRNYANGAGIGTRIGRVGIAHYDSSRFASRSSSARYSDARYTERSNSQFSSYRNAVRGSANARRTTNYYRPPNVVRRGNRYEYNPGELSRPRNRR